MERRFQDSLEVLRSDYNSLRLWEALDRARRLRVQVEVNVDSVGPEIRAEVYQYLAMLHFERGKWIDSTGFYTRVAAAIQPDDASPESLARQALCGAYVSYNDWAFQEMDMYAALGLGYLQRGADSGGTLVGDLKLIQAKARKQLGDRQVDDAEKSAYWDDSEELFRQAIQAHRRASSLRFVAGFEELGILLTRMPARDAEVLDLHDSLKQRIRSEGITCLHAGRLAGYYYDREGAPDSTVHFYRQLLAESASLKDAAMSEVYFILREQYDLQENFTEALNISQEILSYYDCCPAQESHHLPTLTGGKIETECIPDLSNHARILLSRYRTTGDERDLSSAYRLSQLSVERYAERWNGRVAKGHSIPWYRMGIKSLVPRSPLPTVTIWFILRTAAMWKNLFSARSNTVKPIR